MKNTFYIILIIMTMIGCNKDDEPKQSTYPSLNGTYAYTRYKSWHAGLYETSDYVSWTFDKTNVAWKYSCSWGYTEDGWYNAMKEGYSFDREWKISDTYLYSRLWGDSDGTWDKQTFQFINRDTIRIDGSLFILE